MNNCGSGKQGAICEHGMVLLHRLHYANVLKKNCLLQVKTTTGVEAEIPSVCFLIPPPNQDAIDYANR